MSFNKSDSDFLSGPIIDRTNFKKLFGIIYFDLRNQEQDTKNSSVSLTLRYQLNDDPNADYVINALVLHEEEIVLYKEAGKLLIST